MDFYLCSSPSWACVHRCPLRLTSILFCLRCSFLLHLRQCTPVDGCPLSFLEQGVMSHPSCSNGRLETFVHHSRAHWTSGRCNGDARSDTSRFNKLLFKEKRKPIYRALLNMHFFFIYCYSFLRVGKQQSAQDIKSSFALLKVFAQSMRKKVIIKNKAATSCYIW